MTSRGLLVHVEARAGKSAKVEELLRSAAALVEKEPETTAWFALRFGRGRYGVFDAFNEDNGREEHLRGPVAKALMGKADTLFTRPPRIQKVDVLADKLPTPPAMGHPTPTGLLLTWKPRAGHQHDVEAFLRGARQIVVNEPKTTAWFAIRLDNGTYGIFDAFHDHGGRIAHLTGQVPRELAKHALGLFGGIPNMNLLSVLADKLPS
jgi:quinol monooxygenase YgiN